MFFHGYRRTLLLLIHMLNQLCNFVALITQKIKERIIAKHGAEINTGGHHHFKKKIINKAKDDNIFREFTCNILKMGRENKS